MLPRALAASAGWATLHATFTNRKTHSRPSGRRTRVGPVGRDGTDSTVGRKRIGLPPEWDSLARNESRPVFPSLALRASMGAVARSRDWE